MYVSRHPLRSSAVLLTMLLVVAACTGPISPPATPPPGATPTDGVAESPGAVKIVHWSMFSEGEPLQTILAEATEEFMAENPDIEVEVRWAGREVLTQLQTAIAAGTQVDIVDMSDDRVFNAIVTTDQTLALDQYLDEPSYEGDAVWRETFVPGSLGLGKGPDGKTYMLPRDDYIAGFFYNVAMLEELGLTPGPEGPEWTEFLAMLQVIKDTRPGVSPLAADSSIAFLNNWYFTYLAVRLTGVDAFREAAFDETGEKWSDPQFLEAARMLRDLQDREFFQPRYEGSVWPSAQVMWVNSDAAMMFMGAWLPSEMSDQMPPGFEPEVFAFPSVEGAVGNNIVEHWANVYAVLADTDYPDAAVRYLKFILSERVGSRISEIGTPSAIVGVPPARGLANQLAILETFDTMPARAGLDIEIPDYMARVYNACNDRLFKGQDDPETFIDCLRTEGRAYWSSR